MELQGDFGTGNAVFVKKLSNQVTANGRALINALDALHKDLDKTCKQLKESEAGRVLLEQERELMQKDLNDSRAAHNAQVVCLVLLDTVCRWGIALAKCSQERGDASPVCVRCQIGSDMSDWFFFIYM